MGFDYQKEIEEYQKESQEFPGYLCKKCGTCCRSITSPYTHEQLVKMTDEGNQETSAFVNVFKRYSSIEEAKKAVPEQVDRVIKELSTKENFDIKKLSFYYCPHISEDNLCSIYENRPECCKKTPHNPWSCMPLGCGFEGRQFELREKYKTMTRRLKEYLTMVEAVAEDGVIPGESLSLDDLKKDIARKISPWSRYGSDLW